MPKLPITYGIVKSLISMEVISVGHNNFLFKVEFTSYGYETSYEPHQI